MRHGVKVLLAVTTFSFFSNVFATSFSCPDIGELKKISLTRAMPGKYNLWAVTSESVDSNNPWNVVMMIKLPNAKTSQDAIKQAQEYFKTVFLRDPTLTVNQNISQCSYTSNEGFNGIWAFNPPQYPPFNSSQLKNS